MVHFSKARKMIYAYFLFLSNNILVFFFEKYCSESNIHYIYTKNMLWLSDMLNTEWKNIFPKEGGKVRRANQRQPVH